MPEELESLNDRIDFIIRLCGVWDFGILPLSKTLSHVLQPDWEEAVDETKMMTSCAYHLLRELHELRPLLYLGQRFPEIANDPWLNSI